MITPIFIGLALILAPLCILGLLWAAGLIEYEQGDDDHAEN